jgi:hypothetical protein
MKLIPILVGLGLTLPVLRYGSSPNRESPWGYYSRQSGCEVKSCTAGCTVNGTGGHTAPSGGALNGIGHAGCFAGINCSTLHGTCEETFAPTLGAAAGTVLADLIDRAARGEIAAVRLLQSSFPRLVSINRERGALQVQGCRRGVFIASIPLSVDQQQVIGAE